MPRVICDLPNASDEINGVKFFPLEDGGLISDEIGEEEAALFASIPGYTIDEEGKEPAAPAASAPAPTTRKARGAKAEKPADPAPAPAPAASETGAPAGSAGGDESVF